MLDVKSVHGIIQKLDYNKFRKGLALRNISDIMIALIFDVFLWDSPFLMALDKS